MDEANNTIIEARKNLAKVRNDIANLVKILPAPAVQEAVLAQRHVEDARMRLGVALAYYNKQEPFPMDEEE